VDSRPSGGSDDPSAVPDAYRGTSDWDRPDPWPAPREPIGGLPGRRQGRFDAPFNPFQPQQAWLQGSMLTVEFNGESATCDLVTAARIRIRERPVPVFNRGWVFDVFFACSRSILIAADFAGPVKVTRPVVSLASTLQAAAERRIRFRPDRPGCASSSPPP
jgi:hypothetical protein